MKQWRHNILIELYDLPNDAHIVVIEPLDSDPHNTHSATLSYNGVRDQSIPYGRFCEMRDSGDIEIVPERTKTADHSRFTYYRIAAGGKMALQALPNFYRRAERQSKVMA